MIQCKTCGLEMRPYCVTVDFWLCECGNSYDEGMDFWFID